VAFKNRQSRETNNKRYTRLRRRKQTHNTIYVGHHYAQTNTNNINKAWTLLQTTGGKDKPNIVFFNAEIARESTIQNSERKDT
jgi:hypothetical protein